MQNSAPVLAAGLNIAQSQNCIIENCIIFNNSSTTSSGQAYGCILNASQQNRIASTIISSNNSASQCAGIFSTNGTSNIIDSCSLEFHAGSALAAGVLFSGETTAQVSKCAITGISATSGNAYGIYLSNTNTHCYVNDNTINNSQGGSNSFGIVDALNPSTSCFINNSAFNNGVNYQITYPSGITLPEQQGHYLIAPLACLLMMIGIILLSLLNYSDSRAV